MRSTNVPLALSAFAVLLALGCNKHDVPLGGACERGEDCDKSSLTCFIKEGQSKGICSTTCQVKPLAGVAPGGPTCESAGLVCAKAATGHKILGDEFCVKP